MVATANQGQTASFTSQWPVGPSSPADVTGQTITVTQVATSDVVIGPTSDGIYHASTGLYSFAWAVSSSQAVGDYLATWNATLSGSAVQQSSVLTVLDANYGFNTLSTWCDVSISMDLYQQDGTVNPVSSVTWVSAVTGQTLTAQQVMNAQQVLNVYSNYTPESSGFSMQPNDLRKLRYALAYQAVWMLGQPGLTTRTGVDQVSQDGVSAHIPDERDLMLAPLAKRMLKQLSWQKSRSLRVRTPFIDDQTPLSSDPDAEANDLYERWVDMYNFGYRGSSVP